LQVQIPNHCGYNVPLGFANEIFFFNVGPEDGPTIEAREVTIVSTTDDSIVANPSKMP
jgi:hypothetical protein